MGESLRCRLGRCRQPTSSRRLINGHQLSQAICVAAELGVADILADGERTSDYLADATGTNADALYRLLRALASVGVLREEKGRLFALTELGKPLRSDAPDSVSAIAVTSGCRTSAKRGRPWLKAFAPARTRSGSSTA